MNIKEQLKAKWSNSRFFPSDPRVGKVAELAGDWKQTHDWFVLRELPEHKLKVWVDVGYGFYALEENGKLIGTGKDMIQAGQWVVLGEYYAMGDMIVVAKVINK